jgi:F-type H+-transporting ATPase subunit b
MLDINPGLILWTILTFVIVLVVLRVTAWKPLLAALAAREEKIRSSLEEAERARAESHRLLEENKRQQTQAEVQAQKILAEGRAMGERLKAEIVEHAQASSQHMIEQAKAEIQREKEQALVQLRTEVADLAIQVAGKVLDAELDATKHRTLVDTTIRNLSKAVSS